MKYIATTKYQEVSDLATRLNTDYDSVFPGYGRQPMYIEQLIGETYKITCDCALQDLKEKCIRAVSPNSSYNCSMCDVYKRYFKK